MSQLNFRFTPSLVGLQTSSEEEYRSDEDENFDDIRKQLFNGSEIDTPAPKSKKQTVQVFLRVRPRNSLEIQLKQPECFHFNDGGHELLAIAPRSSQVYKSKSSNLNNSKYTFTKIFGPEVTQADLFEEALLPSSKEFLEGQNCLVFTYGVTNSGKTYTVSGSPTNPGLLPRLLDVIFNSVQDGKLLTDVKFKPKHYSEVSYSSEDELASQRAIKGALLARAVEIDQRPVTPLPILDETDTLGEQDISSVSSLSKASSSNISKLSTDDGMSFELPVHESSSVELDDNGHYYSVWVSYAEIYNEFIYDLLGDPPVRGKPRQVLKLQDDRNHNQFIRGLREIQVNTIEEAMLLLKYGLQHRSQAATRLNYNSSRSHSVYTVKLVKVANPNKPSNALVNRVSIVDLAGAERSSKTGASGARVKEAGQINKSLLTLGKCIEAMKHNQQKKGEDVIVPFRESKLTRLFQNYFVGKSAGKEARQGKVVMLVNVSNTASVFDETIHVLKFSALTSKVMPLVKTLPGPTPRKLKSATLPPPTPRTLTHTSSRPVVSQHLSEEEEKKSNSRSNADCGECTKCKSLEEIVDSLKCNLREQEYQIRQEVCREFNDQLIEIEDSHSRELEMQASEIEDMYEKRLKNLHKSMKRVNTRKRRRHDEDDGEDNSTEERFHAQIEELEERNKELAEDLALERERAAAEMRDVAESHETRVVTLNQQLADKCVLLLESKKEMTDLRSELASLQEEMGRVRETRSSDGALLSEMESLKEKLSTSETSTDYALAEVEILTSRISELTSEKEEVEARKTEAENKLKETLEQVSTDQCEQCGSLQEQVTSLESQLSSLTEELNQEREKCLAEREEYNREEENWQTERSALVHSQEQVISSQVEALDKERAGLMAELESLRTASTTDMAALMAELESLRTASTTDMAAWEEKMEALSETHLKEKVGLQSKIDQLQEALDKKASQVSELEALKTNHLCEVETLRGAVSGWEADMKTGLDSLREEHLKEKTNWQNKLEALQNELSSVSAKVAVKNEQIYKMESEKEALEREVVEIKLALESRLNEIMDLTNQKDSLSIDVKRTLKEYETTLKNQTARIQTLERENEVSVAQSEELTQQCADLELRMSRACAAKEALSSRVEELTNSLEDSRKALSQRESELLDTSDQCKTMLEEQIADLKKACATLEHQLVSAREDGKMLQSALNEKESELLSLAKSVGGSKSETESMASQLQELTKKHQQQQEEHDKLLSEVKGNHQLEVAQYTIRIRELSEELEVKRAELENMGQSYESEVETMKAEWDKEVTRLKKQLQQMEKKLNKLAVAEAELKSLKKSSQQLKKEVEVKKKEIASLQNSVSSLEETVKGREQNIVQLKIAQETAIQAVKEDWRREVGEIRGAAGQEQKDPTYEEVPEASTDEAIYDSVCNSTITCQEASPTNVVTTPTSVLKPVESFANSRRSYLEAVSSSARESMLDSSKPITPLLETSSQLEDDTLLADPYKKEIDATPLAARKKKRLFLRKRKNTEKENTNIEAVKRPKYSLRSRGKKTKEEMCATPSQDTGSLENFTPGSQRESVKFFSTSNKKASVAVSPVVVAQDAIAARTRRKGLGKSQISAPICFDSPANVSRQALAMSNKRVLLGKKLRPTTRLASNLH